MSRDDYEPPLDFEDRDEHDPRARSHRGSTRNVANDPRMSKLLAWFYGALGMALVTGSWIAANNLYQLNLTVDRGLRSDSQHEARLNDHETRLREVERDVITIEGRTFRGVAGMDQKADKKAVRRDR